MKKRVIIAAILIMVLIGTLIYFGVTKKSGDSFMEKNLERVSAGNIVRVEYTGTLENGTVFDTSDEETAKDAGLYNPARNYEPLEFIVGSGQMIKGFDVGVLNMKLGEKKKLVLTDDQAYGEYDPTTIQSIPRVDVLNRTFEVNKSVEVPADQFKQVFNEDAVVGKSYTSQQVPWKYKAKEIKAGNVLLEIDVKKGDVVMLPQMPWTSEVIEVGAVMIKIKHNPQQGQVVPTSFGNATLEVTAKEIKIKVDPEKGKVVRTPFGQSVIKDFNATAIILDLNHPLAGKTLIFDVEIVNISEAPKTEQGDFSSLPLSSDFSDGN